MDTASKTWPASDRQEGNKYSITSEMPNVANRSDEADSWLFHYTIEFED